MYYPTIKTL